MQGDCSLAGAPYELRAWRREEQLALSVAPPRGDQNTYPPDALRGALDPVPPPSRSKRGASKDEGAVAAWSGDITGEDASYTVRAFEKQGKSGTYLTLTFERIEKKAAEPLEAADAEAADAEAAEHLL